MNLIFELLKIFFHQKMKLINSIVFFMAMDLIEASGKGESRRTDENDLIDPLVGGTCPSQPPIDGIERPKDLPPNQTGPSNPKVADSVAGMC